MKLRLQILQGTKTTSTSICPTDLGKVVLVALSVRRYALLIVLC